MTDTEIGKEPFMDTYEDPGYARPDARVDVAIFSVRDAALKVLLIKRRVGPFKGQWALPGGTIHIEEDTDLESAAKRRLKALTGVASPYLEQLRTYGSRDRDPRRWSLTVGYYALVPSETLSLQAAEEAEDARWYTIDGDTVSVPLAFDHAQILSNAVTRLRSKVEYSPVAVHLLPEQFTLAELQRTYELILGETLDKSPFRRQVKATGLVEPVKGRMRQGAGRPAQLYRFAKRYDALFFPRSLARAHRPV